MRISLFAVGVVLVGLAPAEGQERLDRVEFLQKGKEAARTARTGQVISESPVKVVVQLANGDKLEIPAEDVVDVDYDGSPSSTLLGKGAERNRNWEAARQHYEKALKEAPARNRGLAAQLQFKIADAWCQEATEPNAGREVQEQAVRSLRKFVQDHPAARQTLPAWERLGQLLTTTGADPKEVLAGIKSLQAQEKGSAAFTRRCEKQLVQLLLRQADRPEGQTFAAEAQQRLEALLKAEPKAQDLRLLRAHVLAVQGQGAVALAELDGLLAESADERTAAAMWFERGEVQRRTSAWADARWDYLRVEMQYPQQRDLVTRSRQRLAEVFDRLGDPGRAHDYRERVKGGV